MRSATLPQLPIFRSELQARVLGLVLLSPKAKWSASDLQERLGAVQQTLNSELRRLAAAGLLEVETIGRTKLYSAAVDSPLYPPLRQLLESTVGAEQLLTERLGEIDGIDGAFLFGSWAKGTPSRPTSDVDLLVVGDVDYDALTDAIRGAEDLLGREVHLIVYTREELQEKQARGSGFVRAMLSGHLKPLLGTPAALPTVET
jgi:predicted nucleotidyltransferase